MSTDGSQITFRDFAGAVMAKDEAKAAEVLQTLLALDEPTAASAAAFFNQQVASQGQAFMMKAMGLRTAVASGSDEDIGALLGECFDLQGDSASGATAALRQRYP